MSFAKAKATATNARFVNQPSKLGDLMASVKKLVSAFFKNPIVLYLGWTALFTIVFLLTFYVALYLMGYGTYLAVGSAASWASIVAFVAACIPGVNALSIVAGFAGWIIAAICSQAMQAIAVQASYWAMGVTFMTYVAIQAYLRSRIYA